MDIEPVSKLIKLIWSKYEATVKFGRRLRNTDVEMPAKFLHNRTIPSMYVLQTRLEGEFTSLRPGDAMMRH